jgi:hypothetical protein
VQPIFDACDHGLLTTQRIHPLYEEIDEQPRADRELPIDPAKIAEG